MKSPFPGMDPYLEAHWGDVHHRLVQYACDEIQTHLPRDLRARVEERVFVESPQSTGRVVYPDVRVVERRAPSPPSAGDSGGLVVAEPLVIHVPDERVTEGFIEIREAGSGGRVVTVIEVLSPSNKHAGEGCDLYRQKQQELRAGGVSLVEVDLLRAGAHVLMVPKESILPSHRTPYQVCVRRGWNPSKIEVYAVPLRDRLPVIAVPLRETDGDIPLDLQALVDQSYRHGSYDDIDSGREPDPPLTTEDAAWADQLLRTQNLR